IGFAGGPFTVACYMTSGRNENEFAETLRWTREKPDAFQGVIDTVTDATIEYLLRQIEAGADAIQIFESWAGLLDATVDFDRWVVEPTRRIVAGIKAQYPDTPVIGFPRQAGALIPFYVEETGVDAVGLDQGVDLIWANDNLPEG